MSLHLDPLHPTFAAKATGVTLASLTAADTAHLDAIRRAMDQFAVLVFPDQDLNDTSHMGFARLLDHNIHAKTGSRVVAASRLGNEALTDISNLDKDGNVLATGERIRLYGLANRLWHTDASFEDPPGRYSMLYAYDIPPVRADTQFADMRSAYDALDETIKQRIADYRVHHSIAYSRQTLGFEFGPGEAEQLPGAWQPLVRFDQTTRRHSLYLASHASSIEGVPTPEARLLLRDLMEHATQPRFVFSHDWKKSDLVIWDNRATMHRATPFDDQKYRRELRRITTLDMPISDRRDVPAT
jgi:alpha-ketoglutarate-dependent 2,4-dichlorophenoxyacetate dioxygenase